MSRFIIIAMLLLVGCRPHAEKTALRVWDWWSPVEGERMRDYFRGVEDTFGRENPDIDLRYQYIPFGPQYMQKIMAGMAAKRPPDCLHASIIWANDLYERGVLADLRPYIERTPEMADSVWLPAALRYGRDRDYVYGIPIEQDAAALLYNTDLFEQAGLATGPTMFKNWEDFRQAAIKLTKRDERGKVTQAGFMVGGAELSYCLPWMYANGGRFYTDDCRASAFNDAPMREALQFLDDLQNRDNVSFPITSERQDLQMFVQGKVAIYFGGTWSGHIVEEQAPGMRFGMIPFPPGPHGDGPSGMVWTNLMCIPKGARNPEAAWRFIAYYCGMKNALWKLKAADRNSPLAGFYETPEWRDAVRAHPSLEMVPVITNVGGLYPVVRFTEIDSIFLPLSQGVMLQSLSPSDALNRAQTAVDAVLRDYYGQLAEAYR